MVEECDVRSLNSLIIWLHAHSLYGAAHCLTLDLFFGSITPAVAGYINRLVSNPL